MPIFVSDEPYKYSLRPRASAIDGAANTGARHEKREKKEKKDKQKGAGKPKKPSGPARLRHKLKETWNGMTSHGNAAEVIITWYTGKDLKNPRYGPIELQETHLGRC